MSIYAKLELRDGDSNDDKMRNVPSARKPQEVKSAEAVRQGHTGDHVRYILAFSIAGALIALIAAGAFIGWRFL